MQKEIIERASKFKVEVSVVILDPLRPSTSLVARIDYVCARFSDVFWEVSAAMEISENRIRELSRQGPKARDPDRRESTRSTIARNAL